MKKGGIKIKAISENGVLVFRLSIRDYIVGLPIWTRIGNFSSIENVKKWIDNNYFWLKSDGII